MKQPNPPHDLTAGSGPDRDLIALAPNAYLAFGLRLGRDEIYAWLVSTAATLAAGLLLRLVAWDLSATLHAAILAIVGPVAEKPGLFAHYLRDALRECRNTASADRKPRRHYLRKAMREGWPSLRADLLYHDPAYTALLWLLLRVTGTTSVTGATLLAAVCFIAAVALASALEVLSTDLRYKRLLWRLRRAGFATKSYHEARFLVDPDGDPTYAPEAVLDRMQALYNLPVRTEVSYRDRYLTAHTLAVYNGRRPYIRFRQRRRADGTITKQAVQVMYTRAGEVRRGEPSLYRCFATRKEKAGFDFGCDQPMPWSIADIPDPRVRAVVRRFSNTVPDQEVRFRRHIAMHPEGVFISVDIPPAEPSPAGAYWIEIKTRDNVERLREVSDYIAWKLPVRATTRSKPDLFT